MKEGVVEATSNQFSASGFMSMDMAMPIANPSAVNSGVQKIMPVIAQTTVPAVVPKLRPRQIPNVSVLSVSVRLFMLACVKLDCVLPNLYWNIA